jgi:hypothetical protein
VKTYRCWSPDLETEDEARAYQSDNWKDAAERFAMWSHQQEEFEGISVYVRCESGALYSVDVEVERQFHLRLPAAIETGGDK